MNLEPTVQAGPPHLQRATDNLETETRGHHSPGHHRDHGPAVSTWSRRAVARTRRHKRILMCAPREFRVSYEINPWMDAARQPDRSLALAEHRAVVRSLSVRGHSIEWLDPVADCPDMCFTANAGVVRGGRAFVANLPEARRAETPHHRAWFEQRGFAVRHTRYRFGGAGDALWCGDRLLAGYGPRERRATDLEVHAELASHFDAEVVSLQSTDPRFYDLDMVVGVLSPSLVAYCPAVLDGPSMARLRSLPGVDGIEVSLDDALGFGCNLMSDGQTVITSAAAPGLVAQLRACGFEVVALPVSQFMLAGGGVRCLGLDLPS